MAHMEKFLPPSKKTFGSSLAAIYLGYFLTFYAALVLGVALILISHDTPQKIILQRATSSITQLAFQRFLREMELDLAQKLAPAPTVAGAQFLLQSQPEIAGIGWGDQSVGYFSCPDTRYQVKIGAHTITLELEPGRLARALQRRLESEGLEAVDLYDKHSAILASYPDEEGRKPLSVLLSRGGGPITLSPLTAHLEVVRSVAFFQAYGTRSGLLFAAVLAFPFFAAWLFARRVTRPLQALEEASRALAVGALSTRVAEHNRDELGRLGTSFNQMASQLEEREAELRDTNLRLQEMNQLKSVFLASTSHELRTPLTAIFGQTQMLIDEIKGPILPEQRETLSKVLRNASSLMALIDDLLDLSKIEAGRLDVNPEEFQLLDCLHEALSQLEPQLKQKALKVEFDCSEDLWVKADFARTRQIVVNLLSNAVKFTAVGGVRLVARPVDQAIRLEVIDTGVGIANEHLELIFDEFRQADDRVSRTFGGTGLGLAIARKLALLQGGSLNVQSRLGEGSTFALQLPVAPTP